MSNPLDDAVRAFAADCLDEPGDVITACLSIAGVRRAAGGGYAIIMASDDVPPIWQLRGMLTEALAELDRGQLHAELAESNE